VRLNPEFKAYSNDFSVNVIPEQTKKWADAAAGLVINIDDPPTDE
jgi:hypothetical protein